MTRRTTLVLLVLLLVPSSRGLAWDQETHRSIALAALRLSKAADARVPIEYRDAFLEAVAEADPYDRQCLYHRGTRDHKEAAVMADKAMRALLAPPSAASNLYMKSKALGQLVHFVADCAVPNVLTAGNQNKIVNYFGNRNFVIFREPRRLPPPAAPAPAGAPPAPSFPQMLQVHGSEAQWAEDQEEGYSYTFRLAVNLVVDALLLLPPREGHEADRDEGPTLFVINRMDTGRGGKSYDMLMYSYDLYSTKSGKTYAVVNDYWILPGGGPAKSVPNILAKKALQVVEWRTRKEGGTTIVKALLFNNQDGCAVDLAAKGGKEKFQIPGTIQPGQLMQVAFQLPSDFLAQEKLQVVGNVASCQPSPGSIPTQPREVYGNTANPPTFKERIADAPPPR